jgi:CDP-diacylglycerol--glycerol-3-phosphate 3-phosphatidyltransferase
MNTHIQNRIPFHKLFNLPNKLTLTRVLIVPVLVVVLLTKLSDWLALMIFLAAALTDFADGYLARSRKQVTVLGKLMDPIADKLLIAGALISLVELGRIHAWIVVVIVGREFAVNGLRAVAASQNIIIPAGQLGKIKMVAQIVTVALLIFNIGSFKLTDRSFVKLRNEHIPKEILVKLEPLKHREYTFKAQFVTALEYTLGPELTQQYQTQILQHAAIYIWVYRFNLSGIVLGLTALITVWSGVDYFIEGLKRIDFSF